MNNFLEDRKKEALKSTQNFPGSIKRKGKQKKRREGRKVREGGRKEGPSQCFSVVRVLFWSEHMP